MPSILSSVDLNSSGHSYFNVNPKSSSTWQPTTPSRYQRSTRFDPFEDGLSTSSPSLNVNGPYTHYYYFDTTTNSPALAFNCTNITTTPSYNNFNPNLISTSTLSPNAPSFTPSSQRSNPRSLSRSPSPPSPSSVSFYPPPTQSMNGKRTRSPSPPQLHPHRPPVPPTAHAHLSAGKNPGRTRSPSISQPQVQLQMQTYRRSPSPPSLPGGKSPNVRRRSCAMSFGSEMSSSLPPMQTHAPVARRTTTPTYNTVNSTLPFERPGSAPPTLSTVPNPSLGTVSRVVPTITATVPTGPAISTCVSSPPLSISVTRTTQTTVSSQNDVTRIQTAPTPANNTTTAETKNSIHTLLSRPLPASSRDTIAGIVASMLLSRGDGVTRRSVPKVMRCGTGGMGKEGYVRSGLSRVVWVE